MGYEVIKAIVDAEKPSALVTVAGVKGSAPRHLGTMMFVSGDGHIAGTVGGGPVELNATEKASHCIESRTSMLFDIEMLGNDASGGDSICGGSVSLLIEYLENANVYADVLGVLEKGKGMILVSDIPASGKLKKGGLVRGALNQDGTHFSGDAEKINFALAQDIKQRGFFVADSGIGYTYVTPSDRLLILGGGHIGLSLARFASDLGFAVTVGDSRTEFASPSRFPESVHTILADFVEIAGKYEIGETTYIVVATPSHSFDYECVRALVGRGYKYAGLVASRRKTKIILDRLIEEGFDTKEVEAIRAPIGIDIGAETPSEIAISILTEIIAARRGSPMLEKLDSDRLKRRL